MSFNKMNVKKRKIGDIDYCKSSKVIRIGKYYPPAPRKNKASYTCSIIKVF